MEESRKETQLSVEMRWCTSELNPGPHRGKQQRLQVNVGTQERREGVPQGPVGVHPHPGQPEAVKCETALSSPGKAGNWQNMNFTEDWP